MATHIVLNGSTTAASRLSGCQLFEKRFVELLSVENDGPATVHGRSPEKHRETPQSAGFVGTIPTISTKPEISFNREELATCLMISM